VQAGGVSVYIIFIGSAGSSVSFMTVKHTCLLISSHCRRLHCIPDDPAG